MLGAWTRAALRPAGRPAGGLARALAGAEPPGRKRRRQQHARGNAGEDLPPLLPLLPRGLSSRAGKGDAAKPSPPPAAAAASGPSSASPRPSFDPEPSATSVAAAAAAAAAPQAAAGREAGSNGGAKKADPMHASIQERFMAKNGARDKKTLSLDSRLRVMRMLERIDSDSDVGTHDLFSKRFAQFRDRSNLDYEEFLLADADGDGRVSNAEWEAFLRKKSLAEAGLSFQEPSALNVEIPLSVQEFSAMTDENEGLHVSINGMRYRLTLEPEGRTAEVIEHKQERLHDTLVELASMESEKRPLDAQAARHTKRVLTVCLLYLLSQAAVIAKLTFFSRFGWDVMEPITYFITFGTAILGLVFFQYHKIEYSYPALAALLTQRRATKLYLRHGFDISRYTELQSLALKFERQLVVLQPPRSLWSAAAIEENERVFASLSDDIEEAEHAASTADKKKE